MAMKPNSNSVTLGIVLVAVPYLLYLYGRPPWDWMTIAGAAIAIPALLFFILARIQLGRAFSVRAKATTLVTRGIYSKIRNPIYVFGTAVGVGFFLYFHRAWLLLLLAVLIPAQVVRARKEEKVLREKFGEEYDRYKAKTWF